MADFNQRFSALEYGPGKANSPALEALMKKPLEKKAAEIKASFEKVGFDPDQYTKKSGSQE